MRDEARLHDRPIGVTKLQTTSIWPWSILLKSWNLISAIILISLDNGTLSLRSSNYALFTLVPLSIRAIPSLQLFKSDSSSSSLSSSAICFHTTPSLPSSALSCMACPRRAVSILLPQDICMCYIPPPPVGLKVPTSGPLPSRPPLT